jgi:hypothetical protein
MPLPVRSFSSNSLALLGVEPRQAPRKVRRAARTRLGLEALDGRILPSTVAGDFAILGQYNVLALAGSKIDITNPQTVIMGNVGLDAHAKENFSDGQIQGHLIIDATADISHTNNVKYGGPTQIVNTAAADAAAIDASNQIAAMTPTQTIAGIRNSMTIAGNGGINVINVGSIQLDGSSALTLQGGANDYFYINVAGKFAMTGNTAISLDGVQQSHVIFNILGSGEQVAFTGKSFGQGTFLAVNRDVAVSGATVFGQIIAAEGRQIAITSGAHVCGVPFVPPVPCHNSLSGYVHCDENQPMGGVTITLTGVDAAGDPVSESTMTASDGSYEFNPVEQGTYTLTVQVPAGEFAGPNFVGTVNGVTDGIPDGSASIGSIVLTTMEMGINYDFNIHT